MSQIPTNEERDAVAAYLRANPGIDIEAARRALDWAQPEPKSIRKTADPAPNKAAVKAELRISGSAMADAQEKRETVEEKVEELQGVAAELADAERVVSELRAHRQHLRSEALLDGSALDTAVIDDSIAAAEAARERAAERSGAADMALTKLGTDLAAAKRDEAVAEHAFNRAVLALLDVRMLEGDRRVSELIAEVTREMWTYRAVHQLHREHGGRRITAEGRYKKLRDALMELPNGFRPPLGAKDRDAEPYETLAREIDDALADK